MLWKYLRVVGRGLIKNTRMKGRVCGVANQRSMRASTPSPFLDQPTPAQLLLLDHKLGSVQEAASAVVQARGLAAAQVAPCDVAGRRWVDK